MNAVIRNSCIALAAAGLLSLAACKSTDTDDSMNAPPAPTPESSAPMTTPPPSSTSMNPTPTDTPPQTPPSTP